MRSEILISAILPTYNRHAYLTRVLESYRQQGLPAERREIIIVDDGSTDKTPELLKKFKEDVENVSVIRQAHAGIAAAKNTALDVASAPIVLFLDDDDIADHDLFAAHIKAHQVYPADSHAILGHTSIDRAIRKSPVMHHVTEIGCQLFSYPYLKSGHRYGFGEFWGGRTSCKRSLLNNIRFNPLFEFGCEDVELGWRLREFGLKVIFYPSAKTQMIREIGFDDFCARSERQGRAQAQFCHLHTSSEEVRKYCEISTARERAECAPVGFEALFERARKLDAAANLSLTATGIIDRDFKNTLDQHYKQLFAACRARGILMSIKI